MRRVKQKVNFGEVEASTPKRNVRGSYHELSTEKVAARTEDATTPKLARPSRMAGINSEGGRITWVGPKPQLSGAGRRGSA